MLINNLRQIRVIGKISRPRDCGARGVCGDSGNYLSNRPECGAESRNVRGLT
jgi:hypothetical protein